MLGQDNGDDGERAGPHPHPPCTIIYPAYYPDFHFHGEKVKRPREDNADNIYYESDKRRKKDVRFLKQFLTSHTMKLN